MNSLLAVDGLTTEFATPLGPVFGTLNVSFALDRGTRVGIVGESGCGKSTTIRALLGLLPANGRVRQGSANYDGTDLVTVSGKRRRSILASQIGFIPQNPWGSLHPTLRIDRQFRNIFRATDGRSNGDGRDLAKEWLRRVQLPDPDRVLNSFAHQLSGGMAQRVIIAMTMMRDPTLILADEPTTALDSTVAREILEILTALVADSGKTLVVVTHDLAVVRNYCERVMVMYGGRIVEDGAVGDVLRQPAHPYTRALLLALPSTVARGSELQEISGTPPVVTSDGGGCGFAPRCPIVANMCLETAPTLEAISSGARIRHLSRCHFADRVVGS
ncbi:ABC transporter ATP-binding protein [Nocardioides sp. AE5]|uniref:ABC transporter ATP-binding protein n=1 Tax=Nocardioides sp. AE5 TaxID=2962573 RepID=UPI00288242FC|nr:ABC transporter ATP-binding protein [Nocardioides sp. AE5]MDT0202477.1 ABC transporter ATP-binding protein [Nocardioides sp. AE5]